MLLPTLLLLNAICIPLTIGQGVWHIAPFTSGVVGIHAALLPADRVLLWERFHGLHAPSLYPANPFTFVPAINQSEISAEVNFDASSVTSKHSEYSPFCGGAAQMANGSILIVGGDGDNVGGGYIKDGRQAVRTYTSAEGWRTVGKLLVTRWYPTVVTLGTGNHLVIGGHTESYLPSDPGRNNPTMELWPTRSGQSSPLRLEILESTYPYNSYPLSYSLPSGRVFVSAGIKAALVDPTVPATTKTFDPMVLPGMIQSRSFPYLSPGVFLPLTPSNNYEATILLCGGTNGDNTASKKCSTISPDAENAQWIPTDDMPVPRVMGDAVLLPDGKVLFVNGAQWGTADGPAGHGLAKLPAYTPALYDPTAPSGSKWTTLTPATVPRLYHSSALLLPSGVVATFGSDQQNYDNVSADPFEYRIEIFTPPYLLRSANRPVILQWTRVVSAGSEIDFMVNSSARIERVTMIRYGTSTHSSNPDSRLVELTFSQHSRDDGLIHINANIPESPWIMIPGNWMLFSLCCGGVPSVAVTVQVQ